MTQAHRNLSGRMAALLVLYGLLLVLCVGLYFVVTHRLSHSLARMAAGEVNREAVVAELSRLLALLLGVVLAIVAFAIGVFVFIGLGRVVSRPTAGKKPTKYVDAWRQYRISDEQIRAATEEERGGHDRAADSSAGEEGSGP